MLGASWLHILFFVTVLVLLTPVFGRFMADVYQGKRTILHPLLGWLETLTYRMASVDASYEMTWKDYLKSLLLFNLLGFVALFVLQLTQQWLPLNPQKFGAVSWPLAFNTAMSFVTNTNWQAYAGETTLSYMTAMLGLTVQNFLSAGTGGAALAALMRGITRRETDTIGNFWADLVRSVVYILLPLSVVLAVVLVSTGTIQNFSNYVEATTIENVSQTIPMGPAASQVAIKQLGTNGGGFFNANSAHPFENPNGLSNLLQTFALVLLPAAVTYTYGSFLGSQKHGWQLFSVMPILWAVGLVLSLWAQYLPNPVMGDVASWEGIETRFGRSSSILWSTTTTATANGSVNVMMDSLAPLAGGVAVFNIHLGEVIFGGFGVGLTGMLMFVLFTVFLSGLMVGRTPEYRGKKIEKSEILWVMVALLVPSACALVGTGISVVRPEALASLGNQGPHGLTEILYAFSSAAGNNGSAFAGLNANTDYYNLSLGLIMGVCRLSALVPAVAIAGLLAKKKTMPPSVGTFSTDTAVFVTLLICVILIVGALTYFPALSLGPIAEHFLMRAGKVF